MREKISFWNYDDDTDDDVEVVIPEHFTKYEVCGRCEGRGSHVNPSVDGHGITWEERERDWTDEEWGDYMGGAYDVDCYECHGNRVVLCVDWDRLEEEDPKLAKTYEEHLKDEAYYRAERAWELKMGY